MAIQKLQEVLAKEVSRKEFLQHVSVFILGLIGVSSLLSHFSKSLDLPRASNVDSSPTRGYGARPYGQ